MYAYTISRSGLYGLLWRQIPEESLHLDKKVVSFDQDEKRVQIRCSDGSRYHGDILVGADGAYSSVRKNLFQILDSTGQLPASDKTPLPFGSISLVGQTRVLNPKEFPMLRAERSDNTCVLG